MPDYSTMAPGVYPEEVSGIRPISGVGTALPAFLGLAPSGPVEPTFVANWSQFTEVFGGITAGMTLGRAVYAYIANGGGGCLVVRVGGGGSTAPGTASATLTTSSGDDALVVSAQQAGDPGNGLSVEVTEASGGPGAAPTGSGADPGDAARGAGDREPVAAEPERESFDLVVRGPGQREERYSGLTAESALNQLRRSKLVSVAAPVGGRVRRPAEGRTDLSGGSSGDGVSAADFLGDETERTGLAALLSEDEVTMVAAPDLVTLLATDAIDADAVAAVQGAIIDHCGLLKDRMAILDPPLFAPGATDGAKPMSPQEAVAWRDGIASSKFATAYYPWVTVFDTLSSAQMVLPPSGFVAGAWARNDAEKGVASAPTGRLRGAVGLARQITDAEQGLLNPRGVNCLRVFRGSGPVIWGARTLSDDSEWRYLNVRRLFNFLEESIVEGTKFAVFEPNDRDLWARMRRSVEAFLLGLWRDGALVGTTPEEAFYVKCDAETNPQDRIDAGVVMVEVGVAPVKPAEFVVIRFRQSSDSSSASE